MASIRQVVNRDIVGDISSIEIVHTESSVSEIHKDNCDAVLTLQLHTFEPSLITEESCKSPNFATATDRIKSWRESGRTCRDSQRRESICHRSRQAKLPKPKPARLLRGPTSLDSMAPNICKHTSNFRMLAFLSLTCSNIGTC